VQRDFAVELRAARARFVRVQIRSFLECPPWHKGAGRKAHIVADEITVD
jgi:hypothetical protein